MLLLKEITLAEPKNQLDRNNAVRQVSQSRALVGYVLIRRLGYKLKDVAKCLGRDAATVSSLVSRFAVRMSLLYACQRSAPSNLALQGRS
jgi:hypothetical protein